MLSKQLKIINYCQKHTHLQSLSNNEQAVHRVAVPPVDGGPGITPNFLKFSMQFGASWSILATNLCFSIIHFCEQ